MAESSTPARAAGDPGSTVPWYHYEPAADRWTWSDGVYAIYGFERGEVVPTTQLMLSHKHPDDRGAAVETLRLATVNGGPFSFRHRVIDRHGRTRTVIFMGEGDLGPDGRVVLLHGFLVDETDEIRRDASELAHETVEQTLQDRITIEQAKGALMLAYGLSEDDAFVVLRWHSQHANIKIRDLATRLMTEISSIDSDLSSRRRLSAALERIYDHGEVIPHELTED
jgi:hypothetical protein